ncbi:MAG TPA: formyltransferase family protein [Thermoleophilaceae bacterium]|nr:formyltransferase family protein [Thermoleophilaceae bacterium]
MRVVYMAKAKRSAARALDWLAVEGAEVVAVVAGEPDEFTRDDQRVDLVAERHGLPLVSGEELYASPPDDVDVVISFLYWRLIREPLLSLGRIGCLNFHPAPLPDMRGVAGYNVAVLEGMSEWGVSCHFVDAELDTGDIVEVDRFAIDPATATALSVDVDSQERLYELFQRVMRRVLAGEELTRSPQGEGRYVSREEFEAMRRVRPGDDLDRKLRAFWYPPYPGAVVEVEGRELTLVDERLLAELARLYREAGWVP